MSKRLILILVAIALVVLGMALIMILKDNEYNYLIGGGLIGGGIGLLSPLFAKKTKD